MSVRRLEGRSFLGRNWLEDSTPLATSNENEWSGRVYAISFDLEIAALERHYPGKDHRNAYDDICRELNRHGFQRQQGSVYFGYKGSTSVHCVLAAQALSARYPWFAKAVKDIRMLRIEETNDLMPAIGQLGLPLRRPSDESAA
jgi:virulence-associated protein VapD